MGRNIGNQIVTFQYQQQGTALGFNQLLTGIIPTGIICGGDILYNGSGNLTITPVEMFIKSNGADDVCIHAKTTTAITLTETTYSVNPYIVASFTWQNSIDDNFVEFTAKEESALTEKDLILCKLEYDGNEYKNIDYTCKSWSSIYYNNIFYEDSYNGNDGIPTFHVKPTTAYDGFIIHKGTAIIDGLKCELLTNKTVNITTSTTVAPNQIYVPSSVDATHGRKDLLTLKSNGEVNYYAGGNDGELPTYPSRELVIAEIHFNAGDSAEKIYGHNIKNVYINNHVDGKITEIINETLRFI